MWKLVYQDTFGFGEDRDPPSIEKTGKDGHEGFLQLWTNVLNEGIGTAGGKPVAGFASFALIIDLPDKRTETVLIDVRRHLNRLAELKQEADPELIKRVAAAHYEACLNNEQEKFWNDFDRRKKAFKAFALGISKEVYMKRMILSSLLVAMANLIFLFCLISAFYLLSLQKTKEALVAGAFSLVFLFVNIAILNIRSLNMRYKHPEKFYIEIDGADFIHSDGNFVKRISLSSIQGITEQEILSRGGLRVLIVVDYLDNGKKTSYSFFKAFSHRDVVYGVTAEQLNACRL